jgi:hypothetical protein
VVVEPPPPELELLLLLDDALLLDEELLPEVGPLDVCPLSLTETWPAQLTATSAVTATP